MSGYSYGHAERILATIRLLEAETRELLSCEEHLDPEQAECLREAAESASRRLRPGSAGGLRTAWLASAYQAPRGRSSRCSRWPRTRELIRSRDAMPWLTPLASVFTGASGPARGEGPEQG